MRIAYGFLIQGNNRAGLSQPSIHAESREKGGSLRITPVPRAPTTTGHVPNKAWFPMALEIIMQTYR